ncbi:hypothetical protein IQ266_05230 [filamentous cyanobacterium LEGE 11480]|uniref:Uncharacterized protein n=1 Tax=Romeriopsis navalis LEGE 11480 TaxID=2777977 RepID=A0A928Z247_9CYAN|nr:hypothetical protein [Romeriopsis navalis]MBE9029164.1 hypothetical protein [Romeriopsis navalis LEGE 11480]
MGLFENIRAYFTQDLSASSPVTKVAWVQLFHSALGIGLSVSAIFDGSLQNAGSALVTQIAFMGLAIGFILSWMGIIFGYGLLKQQRWAWITTLILQGLNVLAGLHTLVAWIQSAAVQASQYPQRSLEGVGSFPLLTVQILLSAAIVEGLFRVRQEFWE